MNKITVSAAACRWTARVLSLLLIAFIVFIAIEEGMPNPFTHPPRMNLATLGGIALGLTVIGLLAGWRWELAGGILSLVGVCLLVEPTRVNGRVTWFFAVLAAPGVLYIASRLLRRNGSKHPKAPASTPGPTPLSAAPPAA